MKAIILSGVALNSCNKVSLKNVSIKIETKETKKSLVLVKLPFGFFLESPIKVIENMKTLGNEGDPRTRAFLLIDDPP